MPVNVGIVGGGPGGLTAGLTLLKLGGAVVTVLERGPDYAEDSVNHTNGALTLAKNSEPIFLHLGVSDDLDSTCARWTKIVRLQPQSGETEFVVDFAKMSRHADRPRSVNRKDLLRVLAKPLVDAGCVQFNKKVIRVEQQKGKGATVHFADGTSKAFDIVIGADGINSVVTKYLSPSSTRAEAFSGVMSFYGTVSDTLTMEHEHLCNPSVAMTGAVGGGMFYSYCAVSPLENGLNSRRWHWDIRCTVDDSRQEHPESWISGAHRSNPREELVARTAKLPSGHPLKLVLKSTPDRLLRYFSLCYRPSRPRSGWSNGAVVVLGDALHNNTPDGGQGANLAVEDGFVLAHCLARNDFDPEKAFDAYYRARRARVQSVVRFSRLVNYSRHMLPAWFRPVAMFVLHGLGLVHVLRRRIVLDGMPFRNGKLMVDVAARPTTPRLRQRKGLVGTLVAAACAAAWLVH